MMSMIAIFRTRFLNLDLKVNFSLTGLLKRSMDHIDGFPQDNLLRVNWQPVVIGTTGKL